MPLKYKYLRSQGFLSALVWPDAPRYVHSKEKGPAIPDDLSHPDLVHPSLSAQQTQSVLFSVPSINLVWPIHP